MNNIENLQNSLPMGIDAALITAEHNRKYFTGFESSLGYLVVTKAKSYLLTDSRYIEAATNQAVSCEVVEWKSMESLNALIEKLGIEVLAIEASQTSVATLHMYEKAFPFLTIVSDSGLDDAITKLRKVKSQKELNSIKEAQRLTDLGFEHICKFIKAGMTEREVALELEFFIRKQGAEGVSFQFIVVAGEKTSMPHGVPDNHVIKDGDFVTMDFGCLIDGYCSDMTRTVAVGNVTDEMRHVYNTVLKAQKANLATLKEGVSCKDADAAARNVIKDAGFGEYFGHGTGHGVGVEIHEQPNVSPKSDSILEAGNVVTSEPGIYIPGKFGVRIEDMAFITKDGCEDLTHSPKELIIL